MTSHIVGNSTVWSTAYSNKNGNIKVHMAGIFWKESTSDWWVPITKGQEYEEYHHIVQKRRRRLDTNGKRIIRLCAHDMIFKTHVPYAYGNDKWNHFQLMWCKGNIHGKEKQSLCHHFLGFKRREAISIHGPLTRYAKLRLAHTSGMPGTFSPPPTSKETVSYLSRHASRNVRDACDIDKG